MSQTSKQQEHARTSPFLTRTSWSAPHLPSQTFTVITCPWFLLCDSHLVNTAADIHYLILFLLVLSFSFRWVSVNNVWIIPVSCELLLSPSALPLFFSLAHGCMTLPSGLKKKKKKTAPFFTVIRCDFDQREGKKKKQRAQRDELPCGAASWRSLLGSSGCCWLEPYGDKSKCQWWLRALVSIRCSLCSLSRPDLISVDSVSFQGAEWLLYLGNLYLSFSEVLVIQRWALELLVFTADCGLITDYRRLLVESNLLLEYLFF